MVVLPSSCAKLSRTAATSSERHCCSASVATPPAPPVPAPPLPWLPVVLPPPLLRRPMHSPRELLPERCSAAAEEVPAAADRGLLPPWEGCCWESDAAVGGNSAASTLQCSGHAAYRLTGQLARQLCGTVCHQRCGVDQPHTGQQPGLADRCLPCHPTIGAAAPSDLPASSLRRRCNSIPQDKSSVRCHQRAPARITRALPSESSRYTLEE